MFTWRNSLALVAFSSTVGWAQLTRPLDPATAIRFNLGQDAPVAIVSSDLGNSRLQNRGGAMVLDLHATLTLRNDAPQNVRGITLQVLAQEVTPGGKGSVAVPSLNVPPGREFPVRINLRLLRPLPAPAGPLVEVGLDGVLFADFSFAGPNRLDSRRMMTAWEMEARRDREHLKARLEGGGPQGLQQEMLASLSRQQSRPRLDVQVSRPPNRAISAAVSALTGRAVSFAAVRLPEAPLDLLSGTAQVNGAEAWGPRIVVVNRSDRAVRYFEVGWIVKDEAGREYLAGSLPAGASPLDLRPGRSASATQDRTYRFSQTDVAGMRGYISQVEFSDGRIWIPSRQALQDAALLGIVPVSPEEQRLSEIYRTQGLQALVEELGKF
jgi:hypothetical protein